MPQVQEEAEKEASYPSLWAQYQKEINGISVIEKGYGFLSYKIDGEVFHLVDLFVLPQFRNGRYRRALFMEGMEIAKEAKVANIIGTVDLLNKDATRKLAFWLKMGASVYQARQDIVYLMKRV